VTAETGREDTKPWLIDKSALGRLGSSAQAGEWALRIERGLVRISTVTLLEVGIPPDRRATYEPDYAAHRSQPCRSNT